MKSVQNGPARPLFARFGPPGSQKGVQEALNKSIKEAKKTTPKFFFKTEGNSMDALKGHQANSKIASGSLFSGPQSLFVPTTNNNNNNNSNNSNNRSAAQGEENVGKPIKN